MESSMPEKLIFDLNPNRDWSGDKSYEVYFESKAKDFWHDPIMHDEQYYPTAPSKELAERLVKAYNYCISNGVDL